MTWKSFPLKKKNLPSHAGYGDVCTWSTCDQSPRITTQARVRLCCYRIVSTIKISCFTVGLKYALVEMQVSGNLALRLDLTKG